ncbi:hydroxysqualene dehydroxylase HpnE [Gluconobacter kondonii]|uniref:hydroxysqualene dehydroxylase HpnE n=1 Tax=Gluconobacter kondonii TaxID=941463 RepID=UPI001B8BEF52|nr:hydroxysqualene dehydroxylase HpnE [Gluconobacter kondonii]MBS1053901.1 FAD-dependent oxidoreductase [Gluconobacter kondonii]MBS1057342.1 FAD-dependent oxidoreductase [Gluconobacter kondonii]
MSHVHIIGGGLAGLSAAIELAAQARVTVYESGPACGGRARSFHDRSLDARIDNGNHLILSSNDLTFRYLDIIGSRHTLTGPGLPIFPYYDLEDSLAWTLRLSKGKLPFWALPGGRRVPGMKLSELASLGRFLRAGDRTTVESCLSSGQLSRRLLIPFAISVLNTDIHTGSAKLLGNVIRKSLAKGGMACCPWFPAVGLSETLIDPAVAYLKRFHGNVRTGVRVSAIEQQNGRATALETGEGRIELGPEDQIILAVPGPVAQSLLPGLTAPDAFESIANAHFRLPEKVQARGVVAQAGFVGLVGGISEWIFLKGDILSVTVSAANRYADRSNSELLATIWSEIRRALDPVLSQPLPVAIPPSRLVWEKRATFAATPEQNLLRPGARTDLVNLALAGDWTETGLPSTIEGSIQSGLQAVAALGFRSAIENTGS